MFEQAWNLRWFLATTTPYPDVAVLQRLRRESLADPPVTEIDGTPIELPEEIEIDDEPGTARMLG